MRDFSKLVAGWGAPEGGSSAVIAPVFEGARVLCARPAGYPVRGTSALAGVNHGFARVHGLTR